MTSQICIDASVALKLVLAEADSPQVRAWWEVWLREGLEIVAPHLFWYEGTSAIRSQVYRKGLGAERARFAFDAYHGQPVKPVSPPEIHRRAWELAQTLNQPKAYDCYYLAAAELLGCEFWTADERLYNNARAQFPWVKWIGAMEPR